MKIAIIEKGHFEVAYTLIQLFDETENELTIFIDQVSYDQLKYLLKEKINRYKWLIQATETNRDFIKFIFSKLRNEKFDLVYFDTIADNFIHYAYHINRGTYPKTVLTLHDIKGFFHYLPSFNVRKNIRFLGKRKLISAVQSFNVLSETLVTPLRLELQNEKRIFNIPGAFFEPQNFNPKKYTPGDTIKIVIPGSIDNRRRNYDTVFKLLEKIKSKNLKIGITLLGAFRKNHSEDIYRKCVQYIKSADNLRIYETEIVDQPEFDKIISDAHFIWMPLNQYAAVTDGTKEQYGTSISTGNIGDSIRHAKPFFAPSYLNIDSALQQSCFRYMDIEEIHNILQKLDSTEYKRMQNEAINASLYYTKEKIIERNKSLFK